MGHSQFKLEAASSVVTMATGTTQDVFTQTICQTPDIDICKIICSFTLTLTYFYTFYKFSVHYTLKTDTISVAVLKGDYMFSKCIHVV